MSYVPAHHEKDYVPHHHHHPELHHKFDHYHDRNPYEFAEHSVHPSVRKNDLEGFNINEVEEDEENQFSFSFGAEKGQSRPVYQQQ